MEERVFSRCINSMVAGFAVSIVLYIAYQFHLTDLFGSTNAFSGSDISKITILALVVPASFVIYLLISLVTRMGIIPILLMVLSLVVEIYRAFPNSLKVVVGVSILLLLLRSIIKHRNF